MNGVFAIYKPSGVSSANFLNEVQDLFTNSRTFAADLKAARDKVYYDLSRDRKWQKKARKKADSTKIKIGHGGTLDPLASGVLVVGVGSGTKKLQYYLAECQKTYETKALLGISTTTGDSEGEIITKNQIDHISPESVIEATKKFIGDIKQTPPIFSALKVNGKPLYEYAREGIPLPKNIKVRDVKVNDIKVVESDLLTKDHNFTKLESQLDDNGVPKEHGLMNNPTLNDSPLYFSKQYFERSKGSKVGEPKLLPDDQELPEKLPLIHFISDVSSGTYIRSLISDIGRALESSAYMVELIRVKQSEWELGKNVFKLDDFKKDENIWGPILKKVLKEGGEKMNLINEFEHYEKEFKLAVSDDGEIEEKTISKNENVGDTSSRKRSLDQVD
ncbi:PUS4 [Candida pseudojiufengensis]|uniref:PUS4 n=1 Tax=Candida pseudojiufengensis TaxID=497109 RepID=UPI002225067E|nr:PUS4 [Candida pseudojiufengensis]KAI5964153.1 PUS4 [Candida pseudojiufengensis]